MSNVFQKQTERFITEHLPAMVLAEPESAKEAYEDYVRQVDEVVGPDSNPRECNFSWETLFEYIDDKNGGSDIRDATTIAASNTAIMVPDGHKRPEWELKLHTAAGTFITVSAGSGIPLAASRVHNPAIHPNYGNLDPFALLKVGEAALIEKLEKQGADWGKGYKRLTNIKRELGYLAFGALPQIGMATMHEIPFDEAAIGTDRHALAYSGTTGRVMSIDFRKYTDYQGALRQRMEGTQDTQDELAGLLGTLSGTVANRAAVIGEYNKVHIVELPDPLDFDYRYVKWN